MFEIEVVKGGKEVSGVPTWSDRVLHVIGLASVGFRQHPCMGGEAQIANQILDARSLAGIAAGKDAWRRVKLFDRLVDAARFGITTDTVSWEATLRDRTKAPLLRKSLVDESIKVVVRLNAAINEESCLILGVRYDHGLDTLPVVAYRTSAKAPSRFQETAGHYLPEASSSAGSCRTYPPSVAGPTMKTPLTAFACRSRFALCSLSALAFRRHSRP